MSPDNLSPRAFEPLHRRADAGTVADAVRAALEACDAERRVSASIVRTGDTLWVGKRPVAVRSGLRIATVGKCAPAMARALADRCGPIAGTGLVIHKHGNVSIPNFESMAAGHPVPDKRSVQAGNALRSFLARTADDEIGILGLSGGASALLASPRPPLTLEHVVHATRTIMQAGASIAELNLVRRHLETLKGGGLARCFGGHTLLVPILSDVVDGDLSVVGSGPTHPDPSTAEQALAAIDRLGVRDKVAQEVIQLLEASASDMAPRPDDTLFDWVVHHELADNRRAVDAAAAAARAAGLRVVVERAPLCGPARDASARVLAVTDQLVAGSRPAMAILGGETTVDVQGDGIGGRNLELALALVEPLAARDNVVVATFATDGEDGSSDAAGAVVDSASLAKARKQGLNPGEYLARNDSHSFFTVLGDLLRTGPTNTNVCDLTFVLAP